jgi:hypothetical protein
MTGDVAIARCAEGEEAAKAVRVLQLRPPPDDDSDAGGSGADRNDDSDDDARYAMYKKLSELTPEEMSELRGGGSAGGEAGGAAGNSDDGSSSEDDSGGGGARRVQLISKRPRGRARKKHKYSSDDPKCRILLKSFDAAAEPLAALMPALLDGLERRPVLTDDLFQVRSLNAWCVRVCV